MPDLDKVKAVVQDATAQAVAASQVDEEDEDDLPLAFTNIQDDFIKLLGAKDPSKVFRWTKISKDHQAKKRFKGWRPFEDPIKVKALIQGLPGWREMYTSAGRVQFGDMEIWYMSAKRAAKIRSYNSERANIRRKEVSDKLKTELQDVHGRSHGLVTPLIPKE